MRGLGLVGNLVTSPGAATHIRIQYMGFTMRQRRRRYAVAVAASFASVSVAASDDCAVYEVPVVGYPQRYSLRAHATEGRLGQPGTGHADATKNRVRASVTQVCPPPLDNPLKW